MPILSRLRYAMCVLIATSMILMLTLSVAEGTGITDGFDIQGLMSNPFYYVPVLAVGFVVAPAVSERMPVSGDPSTSDENGRRRYGYTARMLLLVLAGLLLAILANLAVFIVGKFA